MTKIKICGITREEDASAAAAAGADFLGFIFAAESPRAVTAERVHAIAAALRASGNVARIVGLFRNAGLDFVNETAVAATLDFVQLHGGEDDAFVRGVRLPVIKTVHIGEAMPEVAFPSASWLLFDTLDPRLSGGTGRRFDWGVLREYDRKKPFFLAGGITPENVGEAIRVARPDAVDLASGVESAPGIKDHAKIRRLVEHVRIADAKVDSEGACHSEPPEHRKGGAW